jgi:hypothetical protein
MRRVSAAWKRPQDAQPLPNVSVQRGLGKLPNKQFCEKRPAGIFEAKSKVCTTLPCLPVLPVLSSTKLHFNLLKYTSECDIIRKTFLEICAWIT